MLVENFRILEKIIILHPKLPSSCKSCRPSSRAKSVSHTENKILAAYGETIGTKVGCSPWSIDANGKLTHATSGAPDQCWHICNNKREDQFGSHKEKIGYAQKGTFLCTYINDSTMFAYALQVYRLQDDPLLLRQFFLQIEYHNLGFLIFCTFFSKCCKEAIFPCPTGSSCFHHEKIRTNDPFFRIPFPNTTSDNHHFSFRVENLFYVELTNNFFHNLWLQKAQREFDEYRPQADKWFRNFALPLFPFQRYDALFWRNQNMKWKTPLTCLLPSWHQFVMTPPTAAWIILDAPPRFQFFSIACRTASEWTFSICLENNLQNFMDPCWSPAMISSNLLLLLFFF